MEHNPIFRTDCPGGSDQDVEAVAAVQSATTTTCSMATGKEGSHPPASSSSSCPPSYPPPSSSSLLNPPLLLEAVGSLVQTCACSCRPEEISNVVDAFSSQLVLMYTRIAAESTTTDPLLMKLPDFACPICFEIVDEPHTPRCGHSYCKRCLEGEQEGNQCRLCSYRFSSADLAETRPNVLLISIVDKLWPHLKRTGALRAEGNELVQQGKHEAALTKYTEALQLSQDDYLSLSSRAHTLFLLGQGLRALEDAERAIRLCPYEVKSYFRKASALTLLGRHEDAFCALSLCVYLIKVTKTPDEVPLALVTTEMVNALLKIFNAAAQTNLQQQQQPSHPYPHHHRRRNLYHPQNPYGPYPDQRRKSSSSSGSGAAIIGGRNQPYYAELLLTTSTSDPGAGYTASPYGEGEGYHPCYQVPVPCTSSSASSSLSLSLSSSSFSFHPSPSSSSWNMGYPHPNPHPHSHPHRHHHHHHPLGEFCDPVAIRICQLLSRAAQEVASFQSHAPTPERSIDESLVTLGDFECSLCYRLLYKAVTTTCGHTYCRSCLQRCLDHSPKCPLCKSPLDACIAYRRHAVTEMLEQIICRLYPKEHEDRVNQHLEELADGSTSSGGGKNKEVDIPIFVCTMAFPTVPCMLHVFEPRYRLMIRRCMESGSKRFGMCGYMQDADHNYGDFGTILEIRNIQYFPDGRSVVNTVGCKRFKVLRKFIKDGYNMATIEFLEEVPIEEANRPRLQEAHESVFKDANEWLVSINPVIRQRIITHFGNMPSPEADWMNVPGGPSWTWWLLAILPLDAKAQLAILSMNSLQKRLDSLQKVLRYVKTRLT